MESDGRKHPVHLASRERFNTPIIVFVTVCTKQRKQVLANEESHQLLREAWTLKTSWIVGRYVIMPDHIHLFCAPGTLPPVPLPPWVKSWKSHAARFWRKPQEAPIWQRHFWDTQLRRGENYAQKWEYFLQNPVRAGLVDRAEDWRYQGGSEHAGLVTCWDELVLSHHLGTRRARPSERCLIRRRRSPRGWRCDRRNRMSCSRPLALSAPSP